ncbi:MAG: hypothetical protein V5789_08720 [Colwellia sp.]
MYRVFIMLIGIFMSAQSFAHAGHDHSAPMSAFIHLLWVAPFALGVYLLIKHLKQRVSNSNEK